MKTVETMTDSALILAITEWNKARYNASKANNSAGVFRSLERLEQLWREQDRRRNAKKPKTLDGDCPECGMAYSFFYKTQFHKAGCSNA